MGPVTVQRPKLRGTDERFCSRLFGLGVTRTNALEWLVISGWVRGLSDRDIEAALGRGAGRGGGAVAVHGVKDLPAAQGRVHGVTSRSLAEVRLAYLHLDGSHCKMHPRAPAEPVLCAWGIDTDGKPAFVGLAPATDAWDDFLAGLAARGLRPPLLVISDGAPGLLAAIQLHLPTSLGQRRAIHRARNLLAKGSTADQAEVKADYWAIFDSATTWSPARWRPPSPSGRPRRPPPSGSAAPRPPSPASPTTCQPDGASALPCEHWRRIRHSNLIERTFGETRRRVKVIGRLPGEASCLPLGWAVLERAARGWRGLTMTPKALRLLQDLGRQLLDPGRHKEVVDQAAAPAA